MVDAPNKYDDPFYQQLASATEQKLGLPVGLLSSIVTKGEKSNADQVSEAGARTVFQVTPATRKLVLDRDGIDAYLSPQNAAEVAGIVLKDGMKWAAGRTDDPEAVPRLAAGYYHAGGDTANWGPRTNAYMARVTSGMKAAKTDALGNDFASFMAANPAVPPDSERPQAAPAPAAPDALTQDFGSWKQGQDLKDQFPNRDYGPQIPGTQTQQDEQGRPYVDTTPNPTASLGAQAVGAGEAALTMATSPVGYLAALGSGASDVGKTISNALAAKLGVGGAPVPVGDIEQNANAAGQALTYAPRTDLGQQYAQTIGEKSQALMGLAPTEAAALQSGVQPLVDSVRDIARRAPGAAIDAAQKIGDATRTGYGKAVQTLTGVAPDDAPTPGTMGSAGAAGTDVALQRQALGQQMDVPIDLTTGQATRDYTQQRFEKETMKAPGAAGEMLRERAADQNGAVQRNFDVWLDKTGAEAPDLRGAGMKVVGALQKDADQMKAQVNAAYTKAEAAAGDTPVTLAAVIDHLNEDAPAAATAPVLDAARKYAVKLGVATEGDDGQLVAQPVDLKRAELFRQAVGLATDYEPTNVRQSSIIKGAIDSDTADLGGAEYQQARRMRENFANRYENNSVIAKLLNNKRGTNDRQVAFEDVWKNSIQSGSLDDVRKLRSVLQTGGEDGQQAWRELQGRTLESLREAATQNTQMDSRGQPVVSAAGLNKAIRSLDQDGKLDFIFGKQGAQKLRDINELSQVMFTAPAGSVNSSNTASVVLAALAEAGATGAVTGLPLPVISLMRALKGMRDQAVLRAKVQAALDGIRSNVPKKP